MFGEGEGEGGREEGGGGGQKEEGEEGGMDGGERMGGMRGWWLRGEEQVIVHILVSMSVHVYYCAGLRIQCQGQLTCMTHS